MARKPREVYSRSEMEVAIAAAVASTLSMAAESLLNSGAQPSPEVGTCVMHFAQGSKHLNEKSANLAKAANIDKDRADKLTEIIGNVLGN